MSKQSQKGQAQQQLRPLPSVNPDWVHDGSIASQPYCQITRSRKNPERTGDPTINSV